jgi:hypothetical protein
MRVYDLVKNAMPAPGVQAGSDVKHNQYFSPLDEPGRDIFPPITFTQTIQAGCGQPTQLQQS